MKKYVLILFPFIVIVGIATWYKYFYPKTDYYAKKISQDEIFGHKYNDQRKKLGIPVIEDNWYTKQVSIKRSFNWVYNEPWIRQIWSDYIEREEPFHKEKELGKSVDGEINETDRYQSRTNDSTTLLLEISFSRYSYLRNENPWISNLITITDSKKNYRQESKSLTIEQADSLLLNWGLNR